MTIPPPAIAVIADDLTGATDTGVQFSKQGLRTLVQPQLPRDAAQILRSGAVADVVVVNTNTRQTTPGEAFGQTHNAIQALSQAGIARFYLKIDSLLRGHIGPALAAALAATGADLAVVAPAFPGNGRITVGGYQLAHGVPVQLTEAEHDPHTPVLESHLPTLLAQISGLVIGGLDLGTIMTGQSAIVAAVHAARERGIQVLVADATTPEHLAAIARALAEANALRLCVGTAGLAECLPAALGLRPPGMTTLTVVGSRSGIARRQLEVLADDLGIAPLLLDPEAVKSEPALLAETARLATSASAALAAGRDVALTTLTEGPAGGPAAAFTAHRVQTSLGAVVAATLGDTPGPAVRPAGIIATGGDTALAVCRAMGVRGLRTAGELQPGVPLSYIVGGPFDGTPLVTKAGAFGSETALLDAVRALHVTRLGIAASGGETHGRDG